MRVQELFKEIEVKVNELLDEMRANVEKANKAAGKRARKLSLELEKLYKEYRKQSIERDKSKS